MHLYSAVSRNESDQWRFTKYEVNKKDTTKSLVLLYAEPQSNQRKSKNVKFKSFLKFIKIKYMK